MYYCSLIPLGSFNIIKHKGFLLLSKFHLNTKKYVLSTMLAIIKVFLFFLIGVYLEIAQYGMIVNRPVMVLE